jgi:tRNA G10  N-methylase Trm11
MKYLFILGRNIELSIAEIESFFGKNIVNKTLIKNGLLVDLKNEISNDAVNELGGVLSIGKVLASGKEKEIKKKLDEIMIYEGKENKLTYAVWNFSKKYDFIRECLKKRFKQEKLKASEKHLTGKIKMQEGNVLGNVSSKLVSEEYFVFGDEEIYFGKIASKCDYDSLEKRDMEKPFRRESLAISPRLAKIMINLSGIKGGKILDCFCGIGTILQEGLLKGFEVVGVDKDKKAIEGAEKNLTWLGFSKDKYLLINFDSRKVNLPEVSVMVSEPDLGEKLKKIPTKQKAEQTSKNFEKLMVQVINNAKAKIEGKIVFSSPYIRIGKKRIGCNIENICEKTGYKLVRPGIPEFRHNQIVGRMIYVLERDN